MKKECQRIQELLSLEGAHALRGDPAAEEHLVDCGECLRILETIAGLDEIFAAMPAVDVADEVVQGLLENPELGGQEHAAPSAPQRKPEQSFVRRWFSSTLAALDWLRATRLRMGIAAVPVVLFAATFLVFQFTDIGQGYRAEGLVSEDSVFPVQVFRFAKPTQQEVPTAPNPKAKRAPIPDPTPDEPALLESTVYQQVGRASGLDYEAEGEAEDSRLDGESRDGYFADSAGKREAAKDTADDDSEFSVTANAPLVDVVRLNDSVDQSVSDFEAQDEVVTTGEMTGPPAGKPDSGARALEDSKLVAELRSKELERRKRQEAREAETFRRKLDELDRQVDELDKLGEIEEAELLRKQLAELEKGEAKDNRTQQVRRGEAAKISTVDMNVNPDGTTARAFLQERESFDQLTFKEARGYWSNTYVPGDRELRRLEKRLAARDRSTLEGLVDADLELHDAAGQPPQPFDAPDGAAMAVYLRSDRRGLDSRQRILLEVGLKGTARRSGSRPPMNVGVVLDLRGAVADDAAASMRALVEALTAAHDLGDRFSLTVAGRPGGLVVPAERFRHGPLTVALRDLLEAEAGGDGGLDLEAALTRAIETVASEDDPNTPLGSSAVLLVTSQSLGSATDRLVGLTHTSAVAGVPLSVVGIGAGVHLEELDRLVLAGQGNRRLLENAAAAEAVVESELSAVSRVIARALRLRIRLAPGVQLVDVLGSVRLDENRAQQVRDAENAIDRRLARNLGITADRGLDEEGIQIVIPSFYAEDEHVVLLDLVVPGPGPVADVTLRYKDLVWLRNGVASSHLSVGRDTGAAGPLEINVLKNLLARRLGETLEGAGSNLADRDLGAAVARLQGFRTLLAELPIVVPGLQGDRDLESDIALLDEYLTLLRAGAERQPDDREHLVDSLRLSGRLQVMSRPTPRR